MSDNKLLLKYIGELLSKVGFKRNGTLFIRSVNNLTQIVEIQKYSFKIDSNSIFTINISIVLQDTFEKVFSRPPTPAISEGIVYFNIGELINDFKGRIINKHWSLTYSQELKDELKMLVENKVASFLNEVNNLEKISLFLGANNFVSKKVHSVQMQIAELNKSGKVEL